MLDSNQDKADFTFSLLYGEQTRALVEVSVAETDFPNNADRNREELSYLIGTEWDFSGSTKGSIRLGVADTDLLNAPNDDTRTTGAAKIEWSPYPYSVWELTATKEAVNGDNDEGSFIDRSSFGLTWGHIWSDTFSTSISWSQGEDDYINSNRIDDSDNIQLQFSYTLRRWLQFSLAVGREELDSSDDVLDYDRNTATFSINSSF